MTCPICEGMGTLPDYYRKDPAFQQAVLDLHVQMQATYEAEVARRKALPPVPWAIR